MAETKKYDEYTNDSFSEAQREDDPKKAESLMRCAQISQQMAMNEEKREASNVEKLVEEVSREAVREAVKATNESWLTKTREFTWKDVILGVAGPVATVVAALVTLAGNRKLAEAQVASKKIEMEYKQDMLALITKKEEDDIVRTSGIKALNELNKL